MQQAVPSTVGLSPDLIGKEGDSVELLTNPL